MATLSTFNAHLAQRSTFKQSFHFSERRLLLIAADGLLLALASALDIFARHWLLFGGALPMSVTWEYLWPQLFWCGVLPGVGLILIGGLGGYNLQIAANARETMRQLASASAVFTGGYLIVYFVLAVPNAYWPWLNLGISLPRLLPLLFVFFAMPMLGAWRLFYARVLTQGRFQRHLLIVGAGFAGRTISQALQSNSGSGYRVIGFVDDDPTKLGRIYESVAVVGNYSTLPAVVRQHVVHELVLAISYGITGEMFGALLQCSELGISITPMPVLYEQLTGRVAVEHIGEHMYVAVPLQRRAPNWFYRAVIRAVDIVGAIIGLLPLLVLIPFIWLGNLCFSPGPLFYRQRRLGRNGQPFEIVKFRSMVPDAELESGAVWASPDDPRVTAFGRFLRLTRLDEVPQFWNVFRGEMSLVGPRPERPEFVEELAATIPLYHSRLIIKPGVTGWAQVNYRYGNSIEDALIKLQYDLYYIKHQSWWLNLLICLKTINVMIRFKGM